MSIQKEAKNADDESGRRKEEDTREYQFFLLTNTVLGDFLAK